jgi:hypothetical protein
VTVTDVVMSKIASNYWENNPGSDERVPWLDTIVPTLSVERAGEVVTRAVERERRLATAPPIYSALHHLGRVFPRLVHWSIYVGGAKRPG